MDSDPELEIIEKDSGMSSLIGSKDETPERRAAIASFVKLISFIQLINSNNLVNNSNYRKMLMRSCSQRTKMQFKRLVPGQTMKKTSMM